MTSPDPDTTVRRFIDGELPQEEVQEALHQIADDAEARSLLQFELQVTQNLAASPSAQPDPSFATRTMGQVAAAERAHSSFRARLQRWYRSLTQPLVTIPVRPASAVALVAVAVVAGWLASSFLMPPSRVAEDPGGEAPAQTVAASTAETAETVWTRFVYMTDDADSVAVAGDFSEWKPISLSPRTVNDKTVWTGLVPVPRGEHEYQYIIDGEKWVTDPLAPVKHEDGFGAKNAVLKL